MAKRCALSLLLALLTVVALGCSFDEPGSSSGTSSTTNPASPPAGQENNANYVSSPNGGSTGSTGTTSYPLSQLTNNEASVAVNTTAHYVTDQRAQGIAQLLAKLGTNKPSGEISETNAGVAPTISLYVQNGSVTTGDKDYAKYFACPIEAPDTSVSSSCFSIVKPVLLDVQSSVSTMSSSITAQITTENPTLVLDAIKFVEAWSEAAFKHGANVAAIKASAQLRQEGKCDANLGKWLVAYLLGWEQGINLVLNGNGSGESPAAWARNQVVNACVAETDSVAMQAKQRAEALVAQYVKDHALCVGFDYATDNPNLVKAETERLSGLKAGIADQIEILKSELFQKRFISLCDAPTCVDLPSDQQDLGQCYTDAAGNTFTTDAATDYPGGLANITSANAQACCRYKPGYGRIVCVAKSGTETSWCKAEGTIPTVPAGKTGAAVAHITRICCGMKHLHVGSPLVLDLDDDGVKLAGHQVSFDLLSDGNAQEMSWVGAREAFLALDLDGNGSIDRGTELFGDRTQCGLSRCYDGREALAQYDSRARGGNVDGIIDNHDAVYSKLLLWADRNSDGISQSDELTSLEKAGVLALSLEASYNTQKLENATISSQLQVLSRDGFKNMYDVWFFMKVSRQNLAAMMPGR